MKKKFSFVLAIIMVVCTLSIALVACAPKDPDAFAVVDKETALGDLWDAWAKENLKVSSNTLGVDAALNLKDAKTDLTIALQGGISQAEGVKEVIRLVISDNKKTGDNKNIVDIIANTDGLFVYVEGLSSKSIKITEFKLPSIGGLIPLDISGIASVVKPVLVSILASTVDTDVMVDPVKNGKKTYDVNYNFTINISILVDSILDLIGLEITPEVEATLDMVKDMLSDMDITVSADTTGNTREKVEGAQKGEPKYTYVGGTLTNLEFSAKNSGSDMKVTTSGTGIKLQNTIPAITVPTDTIDFDTVLLTSRLNGNIALKGADGISIGDYTYTINLDFKSIQLITTISECIATGSANPLIQKMLLEQDGKIYIDVAHKCGENCKINHISGSKSVSGSIASIAFSPEDFGNKRVYVSADLRTIITTDLLHALDIWGVDSIIKGKLQEEQYQFSFDFIEYLNIIEKRAEDNNTNDSETTLSTSTMGVGLVSDSNPFSIGKMISGIMGGLQDNQQLQINVDDIRGIVQTLRPLLKLNDPEEGTYWTILKIVNGLFNEVETINITGDYSNGETFEQNVFELYTKDKNFGIDARNNKVIKGEVTDWDKDNAGNVKIYQDMNGTLNQYIYNANGGYNTQTYDVWQTVINKKADYTKNVVKVKVPNMVDEEAQDVYMNIIDIVGLDKNIDGVPQNVKLVLSAGADPIKNGGIGSSINNLFADLSALLKMGGAFIQGDMTPVIAILDSLIPPEIIIPTTITIKSVKEITWDQSKVVGIDNTQIIDPEKTYVRNDDSNKISIKNHVKVEFVDGTFDEMEVTALNSANYVDANNKIIAWGTFDLEFFAYGITEKVTVKMDDSIGTDNQTYSLVLKEEGTTQTISKSIKNNKTGASSAFTQTEMMNDVGAFAMANGLAYEENLVLGNWMGVKITFNKEGVFKLTLKDSKAATINFTFIVTKENPIENLYTGMSKEYVSSICGYEFTKTELEKAKALNTNTNMTITIDGTESEPTAKFEFSKYGTYTFTALDKNNKYVIVNFKVTDANKTISSMALNKDQEVVFKDHFADIDLTKESIEKAVSDFNATHSGKATVKFNNDLANPVFTVKASETNGTKYIMEMEGTKNEKVKLTFSFSKSIVNKTGVLNTVVNVTQEEMGITYTQEEIQALIDTWNGNSTNAAKMIVSLNEEDMSLNFELKKTIATYHTFTITNKCDIRIKVTAE